MAELRRDIRGAEAIRHDLIIVGGGIYGVMLALEATRNGLEPLLLEAADFGGATSHNNLRIVHGGLRYLQTADLPRFYESVAERRWYLRAYPDLVVPLGCLMPFDGVGARRPWLMGPAMLANDMLSAHRNLGLEPDRRLPSGGLVSKRELHRRFPGVDRDRYGGGALWYDGFAPDMPRIIVETLRWAARHGARCLNYVAAESLHLEDGAVRGVKAIDQETGAPITFRSDVVINAAGPWSRAFAAQATQDIPELFEPALAWNVLYDRPAPADCILAVAPPGPDGQVLFVVPWNGRMLVGTGHAPFGGDPSRPVPDASLLERFTSDLDRALPGFDLGPKDIVRVFSGLLPTDRPGSAELTKREIIIDHARLGGPTGFYSVSGIKFTTARRVAEKALRRKSVV